MFGFLLVTCKMAWKLPVSLKTLQVIISECAEGLKISQAYIMLSNVHSHSLKVFQNTPKSFCSCKDIFILLQI